MAVPSPQAAAAKGTVEIAAAGVAIRCEVGTDVGYVAALVRAVEGR